MQENVHNMKKNSLSKFHIYTKMHFVSNELAKIALEWRYLK